MVCAGTIKLGVVAWGRGRGHRGTLLQRVCMEVMVVGRLTLKLHTTVCTHTNKDCHALMKAETMLIVVQKLLLYVSYEQSRH